MPSEGGRDKESQGGTQEMAVSAVSNAKNGKGINKERATISDRCMIFFTGIIALTGIIGAFIFGKQLIAMQGQLDEMKQSFANDRAYVLDAGFDGYGSGVIAPNIIAGFWFNNYGRTPGILKIPPNAICKYSADGFHKLIFKAKIAGRTDGNGLLPEGFIIPVDKRFGPFRAPLDATETDIANARAGTGKVYCEAIIGYTDVRDNIHETDVCFFYDFGASDFFLCPEKGANYHN